MNHIIIREIERTKIFHDDVDWNNLMERLGAVLKEIQAFFLAVVSNPEHFHLLSRKMCLFPDTGWPFAKQTAAMLLKPNVYADFSGVAFLNYPREVSGVIRSFLEVSPEKVLFGSDGFEVNAGTLFPNWEDFTWIGTTSARQALAIALTEMIRDREITRDEALGIARNVLRGNAIKLYNLETP